MEGPPLPAHLLAQENQLIPPQTLHFFHWLCPEDDLKH